MTSNFYTARSSRIRPTTTEAAGGGHDLIAGTAWLFAREELDQQIDYLFVDESGQVSLANTVAMGVSTRNVILVGDQIQLSQRLKGSHPGVSDASTKATWRPRPETSGNVWF